MTTLTENYETVKPVLHRPNYTAEMSDRGATIRLHEPTVERLMIRIGEMSCLWGCKLVAIY